MKLTNEQIRSGELCTMWVPDGRPYHVNHEDNNLCGNPATHEYGYSISETFYLCDWHWENWYLKKKP